MVDVMLLITKHYFKASPFVSLDEAEEEFQRITQYKQRDESTNNTKCQVLFPFSSWLDIVPEDYQEYRKPD